MKDERAYTLIEILIALTIIGLIFGFGYVSFREFSRRQALTGIIRSIQGDLRMAQGLALSGEKPDTASCNTGLLNGYYFRRNSETNYTLEADCSGGTPYQIKSVNLINNTTISSFIPNPIEFKVLGQGTNITGSTIITVTQANESRNITVTEGGEIK